LHGVPDDGRFVPWQCQMYSDNVNSTTVLHSLGTQQSVAERRTIRFELVNPTPLLHIFPDLQILATISEDEIGSRNECYGELQSARISHSIIIVCTYDL
jgi:hypothetical protein